MATADNVISPYESGGAEEKSGKTPVRTESSAGMSSDEGGNSGISELEQMLKQVTVTRFEIQHPATEDLPDEILVNIFIRLLARQLAQMRSVSKSWNGLLSDPSFVKSHLHHSIRNNNHQLLLLFPCYNEPFTQYSSNSAHLEPTNFINHIPNNLPMNRVIGSVKGLICLYSGDYYYLNLYIWNPSLSGVSTIPPPHSIMPSFSYLNNIRFGFDPKTDDYKLIKICGIRNDYYYSVKEWLQVEVYSLRKGCWEFITQPFPSHITMISDTDYLCVDGHHGYLHWQIETVGEKEETILAFDLGSETFHEIPLPDSILDSNHRLHKSGVLDGKLCEISWRRDRAWEVWVMECPNHGSDAMFFPSLKLKVTGDFYTDSHHAMSFLLNMRTVDLLCMIQLQTRLNPPVHNNNIQLKSWSMWIVLFGFSPIACILF